jgi:hypothetical protein
MITWLSFAVGSFLSNAWSMRRAAASMRSTAKPLRAEMKTSGAPGVKNSSRAAASVYFARYSPSLA